MKSRLTINTLFEEKSVNAYPILLSAIIVFDDEGKLVGVELEYKENLEKFNRKSHGCNVSTDKKKITILHEYSAHIDPDLIDRQLYKTYKVNLETLKYHASIDSLYKPDNQELELHSAMKPDQITGILSFLQKNGLLATKDEELLNSLVDIKKIENKLNEERVNIENILNRKI